MHSHIFINIFILLGRIENKIIKCIFVYLVKIIKLAHIKVFDMEYFEIVDQKKQQLFFIKQIEHF
jgi:hypothetical protein